MGVTDLSNDRITELDATTVAQSLWRLLTQTAAGPMAAGAVIVGIILLCALIDGMKETVGGSHASLFGTVGMLACCSAVISPILTCLQRVMDAAESADVFITAFIPVYAGVLATAGQWATATSFQSVLLLASKGMSYLLSNIVIPLLVVSFALGLVGAISEQRLQLHTIGEFLQKSTTWMLIALMTVFVGFLSFQNLTATSADTLGNRLVKFSVSSFIPVVGGTISEAVGTVKGCLGLLKGTVGAFGVLADAAIVLPALTECVWWQIWLGMSKMVADMFGVSSVSTVLKAGGNLVKTLMAVLACFALITILSVTVVSKAGGG